MFNTIQFNTIAIVLVLGGLGRVASSSSVQHSDRWPMIYKGKLTTGTYILKTAHFQDRARVI